MSFPVKIKREVGNEDLELPSYQTAGSAGMDVRAAKNMTVEIGQTVLVPTGFSLEIPPGFEAQLRPRSGLAAKFGITLLNSPGTIDADFRGEIQVILTNLGAAKFEIQRGDRIAQMVFARFERADWIESETLENSERGSGGFGSTGV